jgi:hypothetical protein
MAAIPDTPLRNRQGGASATSSVPGSTSTSAAIGLLTTMAGWEQISLIVGSTVFLPLLVPFFVL